MHKSLHWPKSKPLILIITALIILVAILMALRLQAAHSLQKETQKEAIPTVATLIAAAGPSIEEIILPGNVLAWHEATIYARTNGYIKKWLVDIGSRVKKDDLLAVIETPELDAQLRQAEADLKTAIANNKLAQSTAKRWINLLKSNSVSKQETDEKVSSAQALQAVVAAAIANRDRLQELVGFERVIAPFDGVISSRTTDIGDLINAGSSSSIPLFHIVQAERLRVYVEIPQNYIENIKPQMSVKLYFSEHPGKVFSAKLLQTADAINPKSRTLLTQFVINNDSNNLLPGGYTEVHLKLPIVSPLVRLPVNALLFQAKGLQAGILNQQNRVELKSVTISRDFGTTVEISSGIKPGDRLILNPSDAIYNGQKLQAAQNQKPQVQKTQTQTHHA